MKVNFLSKKQLIQFKAKNIKSEINHQKLLEKLNIWHIRNKIGIS